MLDVIAYNSSTQYNVVHDCMFVNPINPITTAFSLGICTPCFSTLSLVCGHTPLYIHLLKGIRGMTYMLSLCTTGRNVM